MFHFAVLLLLLVALSACAPGSADYRSHLCGGLRTDCMAYAVYTP